MAQPTTFDFLWNLLVGSELSGAFWMEAVMLGLLLVPWPAALLGLSPAVSGTDPFGVRPETPRAAGFSPRRASNTIALGRTLRRAGVRAGRWVAGVYLYTRLVADFVLWGPIVAAVVAVAAGTTLVRSRRERPSGWAPTAGLATPIVATVAALAWPGATVIRFLVCAILAGFVFPPTGAQEAVPGDGWRRPVRLTWTGFVLCLELDGLEAGVFLPLVLLGIAGWVAVSFELWRTRPVEARGGRGRRALSAAAWAATALLCVVAVFEVYFRYVYDTSDAHTGLKTARLWWDRHVRYNSWGFRDREFEPLDRFDEHFRVVILGDSFAFGQGINDEADLLGPLLEQALEERFADGREVSAFNLSRGGIGTAQELAVFDSRGRRLQPHLVVLVYMINDIGEATVFRAVNHPALDPWRPVTEASIGLDFVTWRLYTRFFMGGRDKPPPDLTYFADDEIWNRHRANIDALVEAVHQSGSELVVAVYPFLRLPAFADLQRQALDKVLAVFAGHNVPAIDVSRVVDVTDPQYVVNAFDPHPNEKLNRVLARAIAEAVVSRPARSAGPTDAP